MSVSIFMSDRVQCVYVYRWDLCERRGHALCMHACFTYVRQLHIISRAQISVNGGERVDLIQQQYNSRD